jgi:hypothetical protein
MGVEDNQEIEISISTHGKISEETVRIQGLQQYIKLQKIWSWIIGIILLFSTCAIWLMLFLLGRRWLNFEAYPGLPHTVLATFFAQVVGLSYIVAKYLFPHR